MFSAAALSVLLLAAAATTHAANNKCFAGATGLAIKICQFPNEQLCQTTIRKNGQKHLSACLNNYAGTNTNELGAGKEVCVTDSNEDNVCYCMNSEPETPCNNPSKFAQGNQCYYKGIGDDLIEVTCDHTWPQHCAYGKRSDGLKVASACVNTLLWMYLAPGEEHCEQITCTDAPGLHCEACWCMNSSPNSLCNNPNKLAAGYIVLIVIAVIIVLLIVCCCVAACVFIPKIKKKKEDQPPQEPAG